MYIGSGRIGEILAQSRLANSSNYDLLWGRRALRTRLSDLKRVFRRRVIYLDTVDVCHNKASGRLWLWWALSPYRIEKFLTYVVLVLLSRQLVRLHVPAIADSVAWQKLSVDDTEHAVSAPGFTYDSLVEFVNYIDAGEQRRRSYTSVEMFEIARREGLDIQVVNADATVNASKLLGGML